MADLITAARTQIGYAAKVLKKNPVEAADHLAKADAFLARTGTPTGTVKVADQPDLEWSGTFDEALAKFLDALEAKQRADGVEVMVRNVSSGHAYTRAENIELARSIGVLDELGGDDFFGALVPGAQQ